MIGPDDDGFNPNAFTEVQNPDGSWTYTPSVGGAVTNTANPLQYFSDPDLINAQGVMYPAQRAVFEQRNTPKGGDFMSLWGPLAVIGAGLAIGFAGAGAAAGGAAGAAEGAGAGAGGGFGGGAAAEVGAAPSAWESLQNFGSNYLSNIGSPQWLAQQGITTGISQAINSGGDVGTNTMTDYGRGADFNQFANDYGVNSGGLTSGGGDFAGSTASGTTGTGFNWGQFGGNALGSLLTGGLSALGANAAGRQQANAANLAALTNLGMFNTINAQQAPWREAGMSALSDIGRLQPQFQHQFDANDLKTNLAPNYQFQLDQGLGAVKNASNLQTGMLSGNTLKGINDYAQNFAGNAYQQAFNNYNAQQTNIFNRLANIAGLGQTANQTSASAGTAAAGNAGNAQMAGGAAQAAGTVGATNALTGGANNALGWYTLPQLMNYGQG